MKCPFAEKGCGGCAGLERPYGALLREKEAAVRRLFPDCLPILGAEDPRAYRNKVLRTFANGRSSLYHGIYRAGTHQVVSVRRCLLEDARANDIANQALALLAQTGLSAYREDFHAGVLRHMQVRVAPRSGQALVTVVTGGEAFPGGREFAARLMAACPQVRGVIQNINPRGDSAVMGYRSRLLAGIDEIWDELGGLSLCLNSRSFYQVNAAQAEKLYARAVALAGLTRADRVLDAYCGVGAVGMLAAKRAGRVTGIEWVPDAVRCARKAAARNGLDSISFICGDAARALQKGGEGYSAVFVDPPRAGCAREFLDALLVRAPEKIVYISCNPATLRRDADILCAGGYALREVQPVDLFPYTAHVETVVLMSRVKG